MAAYLAAFLVGGTAGYWFEEVQSPTSQDRLLAKLGLGGLPWKTNPAICLLVLFAAYRAFPTVNLALLAALCAIGFTLFECGNGLIGERLYGARGWTYDGLHFCKRYNSVQVTLAWFILSLAALWLLRQVKA